MLNPNSSTTAKLALVKLLITKHCSKRSSSDFDEPNTNSSAAAAAAAQESDLCTTSGICKDATPPSTFSDHVELDRYSARPIREDWSTPSIDGPKLEHEAAKALEESGLAWPDYVRMVQWRCRTEAWHRNWLENLWLPEGERARSKQGVYVPDETAASPRVEPKEAPLRREPHAGPSNWSQLSTWQQDLIIGRNEMNGWKRRCLPSEVPNESDAGHLDL